MSKILIVDDQPAIHEMIAGLLESVNIHCQGTNSGKDALALLKEQDFDLVLVDYFMKPMNGLAFLKAMKTVAQKTPTILMTGYDIEQIRDDALAAGAFDVLEKPFDIQRLLKTIEQL